MDGRSYGIHERGLDPRMQVGSGRHGQSKNPTSGAKTTTSASSYCRRARTQISHGHRRRIEIGYSRAKLRRVAASPLPAVGCTGREACVALAANLLVAVVFRGENLERGLNDTATETRSVGYEHVKHSPG